MYRFYIHPWYLCACVVGGALMISPPAHAQADDWKTADDEFIDTGVIEPAFADELETTASALSDEEYEEIEASLQKMRERYVTRFGGLRRADANLDRLTEDILEETAVPDAASSEIDNPQILTIGRNSRNTQASQAGNSTLAEPAAANNAAHVFAAGNFAHAEYSTNGGVSWTNVPLPGGPADAPVLCCDHDVIIDDARRTVFHSALYLARDSAGNPVNGVVRIFVRRPINRTNANCSYTIDPAGAANNIVPDYPHIAVTKRYLYLSINAVGAGGGFTRMYRFNLDQMDNCQTAATSSFTQPFSAFGQRVWVPAEGTNNATAMYWAQHNSTSQMRIFRWREDGTSIDFFDRSVQTTSFTNPDCRGGIGNFDWLERPTSFAISGFRHRCTLAAGAIDGESVLACYWNAGPTGGITQGHIRSAIFSIPGANLIAQPHIFNNSVCFGFPAVTANKRGDIGMTLGFGGRAGGGGNAVQGAVGIDDEFTPGIGRFNLAGTAAGDANRADGRYGDYFTIHPYEPCEKWFSATNYAWFTDADNTVNSAADVNYRYIEFGRRQSLRCYNAHRNQAPFTAP